MAAAKEARALTSPFRDQIPPLTTAERAALEDSIKRAGRILYPIVITTKGEILDGHNRYDIGVKLGFDIPTTTLRESKDWTEDRKRWAVEEFALASRNLSPSQQAEIRKARDKRILARKKEGATQKSIAEEFGIDRSVVSRVLEQLCTTHKPSSSARKPPKPELDSRVKVNPRKKPEIAARVESGEPQAQVAADFGVSQRTVSTIAKQERKKAEVQQQRQESAKKREGNNGVIHGDFRIGGRGDDDNSIDLILTDPPYEDVGAYRDLGTYAARVLVAGGWLLAYAGKSHLQDVYTALGESGLTYGWTFCIVHSGGDARFRKFKIRTGWKPVIGYYKPPLQVDWDWFRDVVSGGREKEDHEWQQAESESAHFIEVLCPKHGIVCDPFCGSGTTLAAAKSLERRWLGYEVNPEHVETARSRLDAGV